MSFSARLALKIRGLLIVFIGITGVIISVYLINALHSEISQTQEHLQGQLKQEIKRIINYGELIQLQPMLTEAAISTNPSISLFLELKVVNDGRVLAYGGDRVAQLGLFKKVTSEEIEVPLYGQVDMRIYQEYGHKVTILVLGILIAIVMMVIIAWITIRSVELKIAEESLGLDDLEKAIKFSDENNSNESHFARAAGIIRSYAEAKAAVAVAEKTNMLAKQVAHDIRSPLSALNMVSSILSELPEEKRFIIRNAVQRINDIANDLLNRGKKSQEKNDPVQNTGAPKEPTSHEIILLPALVDSLVSEKRIQYRDQNGITIEADFDYSFGSFVYANAKEFGRLLSNTINNSVEALVDNNGVVKVTVRGYQEKIHLSICDNGKGILPEVLAKLGLERLSHGKESSLSGSGLGVYHAKTTVEALGGTFSISSQMGVGTLINIHLPRAESPSWFLESITLTPGQQVLSLDDDLTIHQIWNARLNALNAKDEGIALKNFTSALKFKDFMATENGNTNKSTFLIDYELLGQNVNGLEIIREIGLLENVVLVTSRYDEPDIQRQCMSLHIKLLPKSLAGFVPILIEKAKELYDWILIDDDELIHMTWKMAANERKKTFLGFKSAIDFQAYQVKLDLNSVIYIDSNLGSGIKGEAIAKVLFEEGFKNLYIATGYEADHFGPMGFVRGVVGKGPP